ncbi:MAG: hypothetical protein Kow00103_03310 [Candidatus Caldatribacteriota bacterium]
MKKLFWKKLELVLFLIIEIIFISSLTGIKTIAQEVTISEMIKKEDYETLKVDFIIPVIQGLKNQEIEKKINQIILNNILDFKTKIEKDLKEYYSKTTSKEGKIQKYIAEVNYKIHYQSNELLSLSVFYYGYTGGAHGFTIQETYNFDLLKGERITLMSILKGNRAYLELINQEIKRQILLDRDSYFKDAISHSINEEQPFYIVEDGIVIYFGLYEIAPYSSGIRYFKIPFSFIFNSCSK